MAGLRSAGYDPAAPYSGSAILALGQALDRFRRAWASGYGLGLSEMCALLCLADGPATIEELSRLTGMTHEESMRAVERLAFVGAANVGGSVLRRRGAPVTLTARGTAWATWGAAHLEAALETGNSPDSKLGAAFLAAANVISERATETSAAVRMRGLDSLGD